MLRNIRNIRICIGKKPIISVAYENERISIKNSLPYLKCVLRLSGVVHGPIYGRFMGRVFMKTVFSLYNVRRCLYFELGYLCEIKQNHHQREFQNALVFYHILAPSSLKKCVEVSLGNGGVYLNNRGQ